LVVLGLLLAGGCASTPSASPEATAGEAAAPPPELMPGVDKLRINDLVTILFSGIANPPPPHEERIRDDGTIKPSTLFPPVQAAGRSVRELQKELEGHYARFYRNLTVTLKAEGRFFVVRGEVKNPGRHQYAGELTVLRAIASASDFTDFANRKRVELTRANGQKFVVDCVKAQKNARLDLPVYPNDQLYVPRRLF
jgi:protein involved in polysaccharide export with SLBB domain